ncbi:hypothetical protein L3X38_005770 [Prunus dulcis]|uniref:Retrovirus-related Pol polyprotein from transposon TNT 1-94 n=1 Tax=Prunus dulcis TaxID=3755 RepID=A0AAD5F4I5_PRUDU|nr:hypothetical protein L3X38_005770 [Prunus dulcis]
MARSSGGELRAPIFNGENYDFWSIRMKTIFKSHGLWDLVIKGFDGTDLKKSDESDDKKKETEESSGKGMVAEVLMKDAKALGLIQGAVSEEIFPRISHEEISKGVPGVFCSKNSMEISRQEVGYKASEGTKTPCKHCGKLHFGECRFKGKPKCYNCDKLGRIAKDCYSKKTPQHVNYATQVEAAPTMFYASNASGAGVTRDEEIWYLDSGCSNHMTGKEDLLVDIDRNVTAKVEMGTGQLVEVTGKGTLVVETKAGKRHIKEIMLVPGLKENLLSVGQMIEHGYYLVFGDHKVEIYNDSSHTNLVAKVQMKGNRSFPLKLQAEMHLAYRACVDHSTDLWHRRFGHLNMSSLKLLKEQDMVVGLPEIKEVKEVCEGCVLGKQSREAFLREATTRASTPLELIHSDICGPMQTVTKAENRGGEYTSVEFDRFCDNAGIERQLTTPYTPQQNGVAERKNRTIVKISKCLLLEKKIPFDFWAKAVNISLYILNRCPTKALSKRTPFEAYSGRKPGVKHLKVFGSLCYAHVPKQQRQKLDFASKRCIFLGYGSCEKGYRLYNIETGKLTEIREEEQGAEGSSCEFEEQLEVNEMPSLNTETSDLERVTGSQDVDHTPLKYKSIA